MTDIVLDLPYPPSANHLWVRARKGMRKSDAYCRWLADAGWTAKEQRPGRIVGPYKLSIFARRPDGRVRDLGNLEKPVSDLLEAIGVVRNDADCEALEARWVKSGKPFTVIVQPIGAD